MRRFRAIQIVLAVATSIWLGQYPAEAQPRSAAAPRQAPALPESGHQTEAIDLNEGKTATQMFASDCAVCHQKPNGLAKGRNAGQLAGFLRQHYTTGRQQAGMLSAYLTSGGMERGAPAPAVVRDAPDRPGTRERGPTDRPPASIGRRQPDADDADADGAPGEGRRKPAATEASKPADRDAPASRRQSREREDGRKPPSERKPPASARAPKPAAPDINNQGEAPTASTAASETPAAAEAPAAPPAEEKPAAPPPPPAPEIRI